MLALWKTTKHYVHSSRHFSSFSFDCNVTCLRGFQAEQYRRNIIHLKHFSSVHSRLRSRTILAVDSHLKEQKCQKFSHSEDQKRRNKTALYYLSAFTALVGGFTYASVLLYRIYCQSTGKGGQAVKDEADEHVASMKPVKNRIITVNFSADTNAAILWNFKPQQPYIKVSPGETALAFYTALNPSGRPVTGIATYNVIPFEAGKYFNKIQCFCFEEQLLNPNEEVDMPVFFYLDPEYASDPWLENVNDIVLSYTFFEAKEGIELPRPTFFKEPKHAE